MDSSLAVLLVTRLWGSRGAGLSLSSPRIYSAAWSLLSKTSFSSSVFSRLHPQLLELCVHR